MVVVTTRGAVWDPVCFQNGDPSDRRSLATKPNGDICTCQLPGGKAKLAAPAVFGPLETLESPFHGLDGLIRALG